jgi:bacterioferritin-associated ferredoxin
MTMSILGVLAFALLFALAGRLRTGRGCAANCGACPRACRLLMEEEDHDGT